VAAFRAGQQAFQREEFDAAIAQFKAAVAADPRMAAAYCALGQTYMTLRRNPEAVEALVACKAGTERQAAAQAAARASDARDADREIQALKDAIGQIRSGQSKAGEFEVVRMEERLRRLEEGRNRLSTEVTGVPPAITFALGTAYLRAGNLPAAERELRETVRVRPQMGEAHNNLAAVYAGLSRFEDAEAQIRLAESSGFTVSPALKADVAARRAPPAPAASAPQAADKAPADEPPAAAPPPPLAIEHSAVACVAAGRFPRVTAKVTPPCAATAKVYFRTEEKAGWFAVRLRSDDQRYAAVLPRPHSVKSYRYYVEATGDDTSTARTPEYVTSVVDRPEQCAGKATDSVETASGIVVEPPAAKKPLPVPPGFSARGTIGDVGQFEMGTKIAIGGGVVLAGAAIAAGTAAAGRQREAPPPVTLAPRPDLGGDIQLLASDPPPGGTISLGGSVVSMSFRAVSPYAVPAGTVTVQFSRSASFFSPCGTLAGAQPGLRVNEPIEVTVSGHVTSSGFCGDDWEAVRLIRVLFRESGGPQVLQTGNGFLPDIAVTFTVVP
jgi:Flp pilus assembly protein TadD